MAEEVKKNGGIGSIIENSQGDKVIWMIVIMLILYSLVAVFSSTSLLAIEEHSNRIKIFTEQAVIAAFGMAHHRDMLQYQEHRIFPVLRAVRLFRLAGPPADAGGTCASAFRQGSDD
jgi:cell division protein FtsW (lipid II flippase)